MPEWLLTLLPVVATAILGGIAAVVRNSRKQIIDKIDKLDSAMARFGGQIAIDHRHMENRLDHIDRRLTRVESWKELVSLTTGDRGAGYGRDD